METNKINGNEVKEEVKTIKIGLDYELQRVYRLLSLLVEMKIIKEKDYNKFVTYYILNLNK